MEAEQIAGGVWHIDYPTEEEIREQWQTRFEGPPVYCFIKGYPPLPGERSHAYNRRVMPLLMASWQESRKEGKRLDRAMLIAWSAAMALVVVLLLVLALSR